jgi:acetylornithine deacetylase/succinyl-diaminopimelate desuccinylase-like protein
LRLTATGRAAAAGHGNDAGVDTGNAVMRMVRVLDHLDLELVPRLSQRRDGSLRSSLTAGSIQGGQGLGSVPALCTAGIDRSLLPREAVEDAVAELREAVEDAGEPAGTMALELLQGAAGYSLPPDGPLAAAFAAEVLARRKAPLRFIAGAGTAGGHWFVNDGIDIVGFGPGAPARSRTANESVPIGQMVEAAVIQLGIVERILNFN